MAEKDGTATTWTRGRVAKRLGVSVAQVRRYEKEGRLHPTVEDGIHYYKPEDIEAFAGELDLATGGAVAILPRVLEHVEQLHKVRLGVADDYRAQIEVWRSENSILRTRVHDLENKHLEVLRTMEELATQRHKREMEKLAFETETEFRRTIVGKVSLLVPAVVNRLAGKEIMPGDDARTLALEALAESLTPEQAAHVAQGLSAEQSIVLSEILDSAKATAAARGKGPAKAVRRDEGNGGTGTGHGR